MLTNQTTQNVMTTSVSEMSTNTLTSTWITTTGSTSNAAGYTWIGNALPLIDGGITQIDNYTNPLNQFTVPNYTFPQPYTYIPSMPGYDNLEEGSYEVNGYKVIIKKIKVDDTEVQQLLKQELGHKPSPEEMAALKEELDTLVANEEREI